MTRTTKLLFILLILFIAFSTHAASITKQKIKIDINRSNHTFTISHHDIGTILSDAFITYSVDGKTCSSKDKANKYQTKVKDSKLILTINKDHQLEINLGDTANIYCKFTGPADNFVTLSAKTNLDADSAIPAILLAQKHTDNNILTTTLGPAQIQQNLKNTFHTTKYRNWPPYGCQQIDPQKSLFIPQHDLAITAQAAKSVTFSHKDNWLLQTKAKPNENLLLLTLTEDYFKKTLNIRFYSQLKKRGIWQTAPVVAMTWYGAGTQKTSDLRQDKNWLYPQIDWVSKNLLPYCENLVFQLDAGYKYNDDQYMRDISDYIRSKGLIPGIWFTPFSIAPMQVYNQHPKWFLHGQDNKPITGFGIHPPWNWPREEGRKYNWWEIGPGIIDVTNEQVAEKWFKSQWKNISEKWNYDFFKIDGQPMVAQCYEKAAQGGGIDGYRKGLQIGRKVSGDKFINACWGTEIDAIGYVDGARIGPDTGTFPHAMEFLIRWNYLNNIAWYCDADAAANQYQATIESVRLNAQARVLTGQQFLTDDVWTDAPENVTQVWQKSIPMLNIKPANLYQIENYKDYDIFNLIIKKPWRRWNVVGIFNYDKTLCKKTLDLEKLQIPAQTLHIYEYWSDSYMGIFKNTDKITRDLKPYEGQTFIIITDTPERPVLLATSRHLTAGALDLENINWQNKNNQWTITGTSTHLVKNKSYQLVFANKNFNTVKATFQNAQTKIIKTDKTTTINVTSIKNKKAKWKIVFEK